MNCDHSYADGYYCTSCMEAEFVKRLSKLAELMEKGHQEEKNQLADEIFDLRIQRRDQIDELYAIEAERDNWKTRAADLADDKAMLEDELQKVSVELDRANGKLFKLEGY